ncbi:MAG TPA: hypothetical protein V6C57_24025 [Coleofasciculaceae cyanobacterium]
MRQAFGIQETLSLCIPPASLQHPPSIAVQMPHFKGMEFLEIAISRDRLGRFSVAL